MVEIDIMWDIELWLSKALIQWYERKYVFMVYGCKYVCMLSRGFLDVKANHIEKLRHLCSRKIGKPWRHALHSDDL